MRRKSRHGKVERFASINIHELLRVGAFDGPSMVFPFMAAGVELRTERCFVEIEFRDPRLGGKVQTFPVFWTPCTFGGERPWFRCACNRRVTALFCGGSFYACRKCCNLRYESQSLSTNNRLRHGANKIRRGLGGRDSMSAPFPRRPYRMHQRTYDRLVREVKGKESKLMDRIRRRYRIK